MKAKELVQYFKSYIKIYHGDELPEPKTMLEVSSPVCSGYNTYNHFTLFVQWENLSHEVKKGFFRT